VAASGAYSRDVIRCLGRWRTGPAVPMVALVRRALKVGGVRAEDDAVAELCQLPRWSGAP